MLVRRSDGGRLKFVCNRHSGSYKAPGDWQQCYGAAAAGRYGLRGDNSSGEDKVNTITSRSHHDTYHTINYHSSSDMADVLRVLALWGDTGFLYPMRVRRGGVVYLSHRQSVQGSVH